MSPYWPNLHNLFDVAVTWAIGAVLLLAGTGMVGRRPPPEIRIVAGWGGFSLLMTLWGVATDLSLALPATAFVVVSVGLLLLPARRPGREAWLGLARMTAVALPLWLVMAPIRPAEPDTWLNLLPNAVYLVDHAMLPTASRPPSGSFLPAAPYNTQFLAFLGGLAEPDYPSPGMSLVNLLLLTAAGLLMARMLSRSAGVAPGWPACGLGFLLATLLDPGFVPRVHLAAYGETGLAVTAVMAGWLFVELGAKTTPERSDLPLVATLGLVLAAMVEIKQSGFGLVGAAVAAGLLAAFAEPGTRRLGMLGNAAAATVPPLLLFLVWRGFVARAGVDELKPLPLAEWQWHNIPAILGAVAHTVGSKGVYFGFVALAVLAFPVLLRRTGWTPATRFLAFHAALVLTYFGFLLLTYVGHFPGAWSTEAHSFFRYETHLTLVLALALGLAAREFRLIGLLPARGVGIAGTAALVVAALAPPAASRWLRFDLEMPQPLVWTLGKSLVPYLHDGDRLALLLPGDNGSVETMLKGVLNDTAPAVKRLDFLTRTRADQDTLAQVAAAGYTLALISCTPEGLGALPPGGAVLTRYVEGEWRAVADWPYPQDMSRGRWQHILSWPPLCRAD
jgi:hypothetical protein